MATEASVNDLEELRERLAYVRQLCLVYQHSRKVPSSELYRALDGERPDFFRHAKPTARTHACNTPYGPTCWCEQPANPA